MTVSPAAYSFWSSSIYVDPVPTTSDIMYSPTSKAIRSASPVPAFWIVPVPAQLSVKVRILASVTSVRCPQQVSPDMTTSADGLALMLAEGEADIDAERLADRLALRLADGVALGLALGVAEADALGVVTALHQNGSLVPLRFIYISLGLLGVP